LVSGTQINDAKPAHAEATTAIEINAFVIWATVLNLIAHGSYCGRLSPAVAQDKAGYPAHSGS
jgi:hypothetical protein